MIFYVVTVTIKILNKKLFRVEFRLGEYFFVSEKHFWSASRDTPDVKIIESPLPLTHYPDMYDSIKCKIGICLAKRPVFTDFDSRDISCPLLLRTSSERFSIFKTSFPVTTLPKKRNSLFLYRKTQKPNTKTITRIGRRDSIVLIFNVSPLANRQGLISNWYYIDITNSKWPIKSEHDQFLVKMAD